MMHIIKRRSDTREKMVTSAALLLREHGVEGTSFPKVLEHAHAPRGSIGHHFPGGKREMLADAVRWAGGLASAAMRDAVERGDTPAELFAMLCGFYRRALIDSEFAAACPVGAVAHEAYDDPPLRDVTAAVFDDWRTILRDALTTAGHDAVAAEELAELCLASLEGALMVARVDRSSAPLDRVQRRLDTLLASPPTRERV
jgi:TetR/AcrR family transcriptional regulator, lmrAB and yxaGH operons repressor